MLNAGIEQGFGSLTSCNGEEMWGLGLAPTINSLLMKTGDSGGSNPSVFILFLGIIIPKTPRWL
jgi:hypothetical protein